MFFYLILSIQLFFLGESNLHLNANTNYTESKRDIITNDSTFKVWLKDSLNSIKNNLIKEKKNCLGINDVQTNVGDDSLSLEALKQYKLKIRPRVLSKVDKNIKYIIDLLKSYDELPNKQFTISFITSDYYSPSSDKSLIYDKLTEIKELKLTESLPTKVSFYTYIRGRLNDKKVVEAINGKEVIKQYNFIWSGNHLIKQQLN